MVPWEALFAYALILVAAALLGWLPFRFLEYISIVDQLDPADAAAGRRVSDSQVTCPGCGSVNETAYDYCSSCGGRLLVDAD